MRTRQIPLTKVRIDVGRLARRGGMSAGEVVEVTRRGKAAFVIQRADDYARLHRPTSRPPRRLWGSLTVTGDLEAASRLINARLQRTLRARRVR